jgi:hypothetical protein
LCTEPELAPIWNRATGLVVLSKQEVINWPNLIILKRLLKNYDRSGGAYTSKFSLFRPWLTPISMTLTLCYMPCRILLLCHLLRVARPLPLLVLYLTNEICRTGLCQHGLSNSGDKICFSLKKWDAETCRVNHPGNQIVLDPNTLYILA